MPGEKFCNGSEQFGKRARAPLLRQRGLELNEHVDGSRQGQDIAQIENVITSCQTQCERGPGLEGQTRWCEAGGPNQQRGPSRSQL